MKTLVRRPGARPAAILTAAVLAASGLVATAGSASAAITPSNGENDRGVPNFYRDAQGMALQLCVDANEVRCEQPVDDHIGVYFAADATAGPLSALYGVEAIQDPVEGPIVSNGARFRIEGARANTRYTIRDPWGTFRCTTDATGGADCRTPETATVAGGYVKTFLRSLRAPGSPFIGNHDLAGRVSGSPTGFNRVVMTGGGQTFSTDQFSVMGQKRDNTAMSALNKRSMLLRNTKSTRPVVKSVRFSSFGTANAVPTVRLTGRNAPAFSVRDDCASEAPGTACNITVTFRPRADRTARAVLIVNDNSMAAPRRVALRGIG